MQYLKNVYSLYSLIPWRTIRAEVPPAAPQSNSYLRITDVTIGLVPMEPMTLCW
jgi:hypothetical protein